MSQLKRPQDPLSDVSPEALNAVDQLWKFQIRKEQKAILEHFKDLETLEKAAQVLPATVEKKIKDCEDMMATLAARVNKLTDECARYREEKENFNRETARRNEQIEMLYSRLSQFEVGMVARLHADAGQGTCMIPEQEQMMEEGQALQRAQLEEQNQPARPAIQSEDQYTNTNQPDKGVSPQEPSILSPSHLSNETPKQNAITTDDAATPAIAASNGTRKAPRRPANRKSSQNGPEKVHTTRSKKAEPTNRPKATPASIPKSHFPSIPQLFQGPVHIANYYASTAAAHAALSPLSTDGEEEFVMAFVYGITSAKDQEALLEVMKEDHLFRSMKDGKLKFICRWDDVKAALVKAGVLSENGGVVHGREKGRGKKRRLGELNV